MSKMYQVTIAMVAITGIVGLNLVYAEEPATTATSPTKTPTQQAAIDPTLAAQLSVIEQQPTIPANSLPLRSPGTFYSAQNLSWPPMPGNVNSLALWSLGDDTYLLDDLAVDYAALLAAAEQTNSNKAKIAQVAGGSSPKPRISSNQPVLTIGPAGPGALTITVTNGMPPENYELYWTPVLANVSYPWQAIAVGTTGQTTFTVNSSTYPIGFFRVNWDTNTIPLWKAADPNNQATGVLTVWIDSPANGTTLN